MTIENIITQSTIDAIKSLYDADVDTNQIQIQQTRKDFEGDRTVVVFPFLRLSKKKPEQTGEEIGGYMKENIPEIKDFNVIKGFLNLSVSDKFWIDYFAKAAQTEGYGTRKVDNDSKTIMIEYSSPNTNKPLHLGHIRNNLLGYSVAEILKANGYKVIKTNIVNDRGIHICKSMLAWQRFSNGETPETSGKKGDHLVGDYYVKFDQEYKKEVSELVAKGMTEDEAKKKAPVLLDAQEMLRKWEAGDEETVELWKKMNQWVYDGFDDTYRKLGVDFNIIYYESDTYKLGKEKVLKGLDKGILFKKEDNSVWADLTDKKLDEKILLRADGTSVYMTQDIGTAIQRYEGYKFDKHIYVVGNEQDYHFQVLALILQKLGYKWAENLFHLSYGMVELPEGKMKSREGTIVDADDLIAEMIKTARETSDELGKLDGYTDSEKAQVYKTVGLGALKYFILKVDPKKNMLFNPKESIDFNGNTGPFIQYTYARVQSVLRKAQEAGITTIEISDNIEISEKEKALLKNIYRFPVIVKEAGESYSPALIANFVYEYVKEYNQFYKQFPIIKEDNYEKRNFRLLLSDLSGKIIKTGMSLLGINVPERM